MSVIERTAPGIEGKEGKAGEKGGTLEPIAVSAESSPSTGQIVLMTGTHPVNLPESPALGAEVAVVALSGTTTVKRKGTNTITAPGGSALTELAIAAPGLAHFQYKEGVWYLTAGESVNIAGAQTISGIKTFSEIILSTLVPTFKTGSLAATPTNNWAPGVGSYWNFSPTSPLVVLTGISLSSVVATVLELHNPTTSKAVVLQNEEILIPGVIFTEGSKIIKGVPEEAFQILCVGMEALNVGEGVTITKLTKAKGEIEVSEAYPAATEVGELKLFSPSTATNRFAFPEGLSFEIPPHATIRVLYASGPKRWEVLSASPGVVPYTKAGKKELPVP